MLVFFELAETERSVFSWKLRKSVSIDIENCSDYLRKTHPILH